MLAGLHTKTTQEIFTKFGGKAAHEPRRNPLDFGVNPDHVTLGLEYLVGLRFGGGQVRPRITGSVLPGASSLGLIVTVLRDYGYTAYEFCFWIGVD